MLRIACITLAALFSSEAFSQCCTANPVAGSANIGVLTKKTFRFITYYRFNYADTYFEGSKKSGFDFLKNSNYNFIGTIFSYGITGKLTADLELGYYINRSEKFNTDPPYTSKGRGFSNGLASLKYALYQKKDWELTAGAGFKFPFTRKLLIVDGVQLPLSIQPSTGAFGAAFLFFARKSFPAKGFRLFLIHRTEINGTNTVDYKYSSSHNTSFFVSKTINKNWTALLQLRSDIRQRDTREGQTIAASGGYLLLVAPQINYTIRQQWNIAVLADIPVFKYYHGTQLSTKFALVLSLTKDFDFSKKR